MWRQADRHRVPRIAFINKMDKVGADFAMCVESMRQRLGAHPVAIQLPLGEAGENRGVIDLIHRVACLFDEEGAATMLPIPEIYRAAAESARLRLIEEAATLTKSC